MAAPIGIIILGIIVAIPLGVVATIYLVMPVCRAIAWVVGQCVKFTVAMISDAARLVGTALTAVVLSPLALVNVIFGRWSAAQHYGRAVWAELGAAGACMFRLCVGHPARLVGLKSLVEGLEQRVPAVVAGTPPPTRVDQEYMESPAIIDQAAAPSMKTGSVKAGQFPGYKVIGTLSGGGSGGKLYIAQPETAKLAALARQGFQAVGDVVIKSFSVAHGSSLPQIVRESRALEAAKKLGLVLEHDLTPERFYYVMRYVPGDSLGLVSQRLHARCPGGLKGRELHECLSYAADLIATLCEYHKSGLWHKDVKPDNIIVSAGRAHLVDFGLITPLRSSMTLTTHGTEYFRDPEMVRLALKGVKVHEVNGAKFDIYAAGAVMFSVIENSFPAHGGLSQISRPCPDAVRWIVRRAMTDYDKRYPDAQAMLADLRTVIAAAAAGAAESLRPADLPSVKQAGEMNAGNGISPDSPAGAFAGAAGYTGAMPPPLPAQNQGAYQNQGWDQYAAAYGAPPVPPVGRYQAVGIAARRHTPGRPAHEQLKTARARAAEARKRIQTRMGRLPRANRGVGAGVFAALLTCGVAAALGVVGYASATAARNAQITVTPSAVDESAVNVVIETGGQRTTIVSTGTGNSPNEKAASGSRRERVAQNKPRQPVPPSPPAAPAPAMVDADGATVLVMSDLENVGRLRPVVTGLTGMSFTVRCVGLEDMTAGNDEDEVKQNQTLSAGLRNAVQLKPVPGDASREAIRKWLASNRGVSAVVWVNADVATPNKVSAWVVGADGTPQELISAIGGAFKAIPR